MNPQIKKIKARRVLDSRGWPTVEVEMTSDNFTETAIVPSGASTGVHEALELRDKSDEKNPFFMNKDVRSAVQNVNEKIAPALIGHDLYAQMKIDEKLLELDGTKNKENLGANAILAVSLAAARLSAKERGIPLYQRFTEIAEFQNGPKSIKYPTCLPVPMVNVINGGQHANSNLAIQEFMFLPFGENYSESLAMASDLFHALQKKLKKIGVSTAVGDEGGVALFLGENFRDTESVFSFMLEIISECGFDGKVKIAIDAAASEFFENGVYTVDGKNLTGEELLSFYKDLVNKFPIISIEDGFDEDDWENWQKATEVLGEKILLVGDDLFVTNKERLKMGIEKKAGNALLVKINQIGTITETIEAVNLAYENGMHCVVSHRSGETEDTSIADLAVGLGSRFIKTGSLSRTERIAKYNRLLRIEEELGTNAKYREDLEI